MRTLLISDIHGCLDEFKLLLKKLDLHSDDQLILIGDLVDRGPQSAEVVRLARKLGATFILGNHEANHLTYREYHPGGKKHLRHLPPHKQLVQETLSDKDWKYIEAGLLHTSFQHLGKTWVAVHAGLEPGRPVSYQERDTYLRMRYFNKETGRMVSIKKHSVDTTACEFWANAWPGPENIVFGHQVLPEPTIFRPNDSVECIGIDTGCVYGGQLTCLVFPEDGPYYFVAVKAKKVYYEKSTYVRE